MLFDVKDDQVKATTDEIQPVVINTWVTNGFIDATKHAWDKLKDGASALDAVEHGCNWCEEL